MTDNFHSFFLERETCVQETYSMTLCLATSTFDEQKALHFKEI